MQATLGDLVKFVLENRRGKAFFGYNEADIAYEIKASADELSLQYAKADDGKVVGIVVASVDTESKIYYIKAMLTTEKWAIGSLLNSFNQRWPNFVIKAQRWKGSNRSKRTFVTYNMKKLTSMLVKQETI